MFFLATFFSSWYDYLLNYLCLCGHCQTVSGHAASNIFIIIATVIQFQLVDFIFHSIHTCITFSPCALFQPPFYVASAAFLLQINIMYKNAPGASDMWGKFPSNMYCVCSSYIIAAPVTCYHMCSSFSTQCLMMFLMSMRDCIGPICTKFNSPDIFSINPPQ